MAQKRRPYDLLLLMTVEFLIVVLAFYTGAIMLALAYGSSIDQILENIGSGASQWLYNDPKGAMATLGWMFAAVTGITLLEIWGLLNAKRFSYVLGIAIAFVIMLVNVITLMSYGFNNLQLAFRLVMGAVLPLVAVYYLTRPSIKKYLLV